MESILTLISGPMFAPIAMLVGFFATQWYNNKKSHDNIQSLSEMLKARLEKDVEQDEKIVNLEKDMIKVKAEQEGMASTLIAKIVHVEELVKSLRDWIHKS